MSDSLQLFCFMTLYYIFLSDRLIFILLIIVSANDRSTPPW